MCNLDKNIVTLYKLVNNKVEALEFVAKPKSKAECPSASEYKVTRIDGGRRNLYIAGINESFSSVGDKNLGNLRSRFGNSRFFVGLIFMIFSIIKNL